MPFEAPFRTFEVGDLVYGVHKGAMGMGRADYLNRLFKGGVTIEQYDIINGEANVGRPADYAGFAAALGGHDKYQAAVGGEYNNANVRMKDKGGLYWAVQAGKYVNFVLDGLDIPAVVGKSFAGANPDRDATDTTAKNRSITGAELRWIYRNRFRAGVQHYIQFWFFDACVVPPWVTYGVFDFQTGDVDLHDGAALWATYTPTTVVQGPV